jgi:hypothetical protein
MIIQQCPACKKMNRIKTYDNKIRPVCGNCGAPLIDKNNNSHDLSKSCVLCGKSSGSLDILSNGSAYHNECYSDLKSDINAIESQISEIHKKIGQLELQLIEANSPMNKIKNWILKKAIDIQSIEKQISIEKNRIIELTDNAEKSKEILYDLHTYWLTYPPDWEERRAKVNAAGRFCHECGIYDSPLHMHHARSISRGGDHSIENLILLSEQCHKELHGGRQFSYSETKEIGAFGKRVKLIQEAIDNQGIIHFQYTKYEGEKSVRSIRPEGLKQIGQSLCVSGYCYLRDDSRVFAIHRMKGVKIVSEPGNCYDI